MQKRMIMGINTVQRKGKRVGTLFHEFIKYYRIKGHISGPYSAVGNMSGYRCVSDCRSRGRKFDPGPVPYFRGD